MIIANFKKNATAFENDPTLSNYIARPHWEIYELNSDPSSKGGIRKRVHGVMDGKVLSSVANSVEGDTDWSTCVALTTPKRCPLYHFTDSDPFIGIDIDDVDFGAWKASGEPFVIPFPVTSFYAEVSPREQGVHLFCVLKDITTKQQINSTLFNDKAYQIKSNEYSWCKKHIEYRCKDCLLSLSGNKISISSITPYIKTFEEALLERCCRDSELFSQYYYAFKYEDLPEGASSKFFAMLRLLYRESNKLILKDSFYSILKNASIFATSTSWSGVDAANGSTGKLYRLIYDDSTWKNVVDAENNPESKYVDTESTALISSIIDIEKDCVASPVPLSTLPDSVSLSSLSLPDKQKKQKIDELYVAEEFLSSPDSVATSLLYIEPKWYKYNESSFYTNYTSQAIEDYVEVYMQSYLAASNPSLQKIKSISGACVRKLRNAYVMEKHLAITDNNTWADKELNQYKWLHLSDALYNIDTHTFMPETKDFFSTYKLSISSSDLMDTITNYTSLYDASAFRAFLESSFNEDFQVIRMIQEFCGSMLASEIKGSQYMLCLVGQPGSGKGTFVSLLQHLFKSFSTSVSLLQLNDKFGLSSLVDKRLVVINELPIDMKKYTHGWDTIQQLVAGDELSIERKGETAYTAILPCKLILCSNHKLNAPSIEAIHRRSLIAPMKQAFAGVKELEKDYANILLTPEEQKVVLAWMIRGYHMFKRYGIEEAASSKLEKTINSEDSIAAFICSDLKKGELKNPSHVILNSTLRDLYHRYCDREHIDQSSRVRDRNIPQRVKNFIAKNWFHTSTDAVNRSSSVGEGAVAGINTDDILEF